MALLKNCGVNLNIGLIQTAYANGASTKYIQNELVCLLSLKMFFYNFK